MRGDASLQRRIFLVAAPVTVLAAGFFECACREGRSDVYKQPKAAPVGKHENSRLSSAKG